MAAPPLDLLIIGAGPVGLATAVGAIHRGAKRVLIVEQASELRPVGRFLDLMPNAVRALSALAPGLRESFEPYISRPLPGKPPGLQISVSGRAISGRDSRKYGDSGSILWWQLQRLFLDALPDPGIVVLNHQLVDIVQEPGTGVACAVFVANRQRKNPFKNWGGDSNDQEDFSGLARESGIDDSKFEVCESRDEDRAEYGSDVQRLKCRAKLIVGADGINSVARRCIYRDSGGWEEYAEAVYSGFALISAAGFPSIAAEDERMLENLYVQGSQISLVTCEEENVSHSSLRVMVAHPQKKAMVPFSWYVGYYLAVDEGTVKSLPAVKLGELALETAREAGVSEKLRAMSEELLEGSHEGNFPILPFYVVPATHPPPYAGIASAGSKGYPEGFRRMWHFGRVVLAGDAAHALPPFLAQGTAMGLEDAHALVALVGATGLWGAGGATEQEVDEVLARYEARRMERVCFVQNRTLNRTSEYDVERLQEDSHRLWSYDAVAEYPE